MSIIHKLGLHRRMHPEDRKAGIVLGICWHDRSRRIRNRSGIFELKLMRFDGVMLMHGDDSRDIVQRYPRKDVLKDMRAVNFQKFLFTASLVVGHSSRKVSISFGCETSYISVFPTGTKIPFGDRD